MKLIIKAVENRLKGRSLIKKNKNLIFFDFLLKYESQRKIYLKYKNLSLLKCKYIYIYKYKESIG